MGSPWEPCCYKIEASFDTSTGNPGVQTRQVLLHSLGYAEIKYGVTDVSDKKSHTFFSGLSNQQKLRRQ